MEMQSKTIQEQQKSHIYIRTNIYEHICTYIHVYIYIYTWINVYIYTYTSHQKHLENEKVPARNNSRKGV